MTYLISTVLFTFTCWGYLIFTGSSVTDLPGLYLYYIGGAGPLIMAVVFLIIDRKKQVAKTYWKRLLGVKQIGWRWWLIAIFSMPFLTILSMLIASLLHQEKLTFELLVNLFSVPGALLPFLVFLFFIGPLPEEMGWRGFGLESLQQTRSALTSSLWLAAFWMIWHLPLYFIPGTFQYETGITSPEAWILLVSILPQTVIITWIYNNTASSTLTAVIFHFMTNLSGELLEPSVNARFYQMLLLFLFATLIQIIFSDRMFKLSSVPESEKSS